VKFWFDFLNYIVTVIEEDKNIYTPALNQFPQELNVGNLSAATLWELYKIDLKTALEGIVKNFLLPQSFLVGFSHLW
jgi:protein unc-13 A/B/C